MLDKLDFNEIVFFTASCVQYRPKSDPKNRLDGVPREHQADVSRLKREIDTAFCGKAQDQHQPDKRVILLDDMRLIVRAIAGAHGEIHVCSPLPSKPPALSSLDTVAKPARMELIRYLESGNGGIILISSVPNQGNCSTGASIFTTYIETHGGTGAYISRRHDYELSGPTDNMRGLVVPFVLPSSAEAVGDLLVRALMISPRLAFVDSMSTPDDAKLCLELASSGVLVITSVDAGGIVPAMDLMITKGAAAYSNLNTSREVLSTVLRAAIHTRSDGKGTKSDYFFLGDPNTHPTHQKSSEKIRNGNTSTLGNQVTDHTMRIHNDQSPFVSLSTQRVA